MSAGRWIIALNRADCITLAGLLTTLCGCLLALQGRPAFALATLFLAMLMDALDGMLARRWGLASEFGRYLDGFVDAFLYLFAPLLVLEAWGFLSGWGIPAYGLALVAGVLRLSVFNQIGNVKSEEGSLAYLGMPVFWLNLVLGAVYLLAIPLGRDLIFGLLCVLYPVMAALMLWRRPFFKFSSLRVILAIVLGGGGALLAAGVMGY